MADNTNAVVKFIRNDTIQERIENLLADRAAQFTTSLITAVNSNDRLAKCKPDTVLNAALTAASMNLPINQNLGFAALVPYGNECQFQMMVKGFVQLAQRSGRYRTISAAPVYEGQLTSNDPLRGITFDWTIKPEPGATPIGFVAFFELLNGFEKTLYMTMDEVKAHGKRYSKTFNNGPWKDNFEAMALKTVLKLLISRFGPMSTEMETAIQSDQAVISDKGRKYIDHDEMAGERASEDEEAAIIDANMPPEGEQVTTPTPATPKPPAKPKDDKPQKSVAERGKEFAEKGKAANAAKNKSGQAELPTDDTDT